MRYFSILSLILFLFVGITYSTPKSQLSAQQIINDMTAVYAACTSYADEGEVTTIFIQTTGNSTNVKPFSTAFVRPSNFRFEYQDKRGKSEWNSYIIWKAEDSIKTWWSIKPEIQSPKDLTVALATAAGVSSGASTIVPSLLIPEVSMYNRFKFFSDLKLIGEEKINDKAAYKIEGTDLRKNIVTVWIDKEKLLAVKIFEKHKFDKFKTETTTTFKPQINIKIAQDKLAFNVPEKAK